MTNKKIAKQIVSNINNSDNIQDITLDVLKAPIKNGETVFHKVFIKDAIDGLSKLILNYNENLNDLLKIQDNNGQIPIEKIDNKEQFKKVSLFFNNHAKVFLTAQSYDKATYLQLQLAAEAANTDLINAVMEFANQQNVLKETLMAKDKFSQTPVTTAIAKNNVNFITNVFGMLIDEDKTAILGQKLKSNNNTLHKAFTSDDEQIVKFFAKALKTADKDALKKANYTGEMSLSLLLKNQYFVAAFKDNKTVILEAILENITALKAEDGFATKFAAVYEAIDNTLKNTVLAAINLEEDCGHFPDEAIKDKLAAAEKSLADGIQGDEFATLKTPLAKIATLKTPLAKIATYSNTFKNKTPDNFGNSVKAAVTTKLNAVTDAQKAFSAADAEGLATALKNAKADIDLYNEVYTQLNDENVTLDNAKTALDAAAKAKAQELVDAECSDVVTLANAKACKTFIESFKSEATLGSLVDQYFANEKLQQAEKTIEANTIQPAYLLKGTVLAFYMFKDKQVLEVMNKYAEAQSKSNDITTNLKTLINLKTEIDSGMNEVMGFGDDDSVKIYGKDYQTFYNIILKMENKPGLFKQKFENKETNGFKEYFVESWQDEGEDQAGYIYQNMKDAKNETCEAFKIQNGCSEAKILEVIHNEYCKDKSDLTDPADKLFCSKQEGDQYKFTEAADFTIFTGLTDLETNIDQYIN